MSRSDSAGRPLSFASSLAIVAVCGALFTTRAMAQQAGQLEKPGEKPALEPAPFSLDIDAASSGNPLVVTRPDNGVIPVRILNGGTREATVQAEASLFAADTGSVGARVMADCTKPPVQAVQTVSITLKPAATQPMCLVVDPLPTAAKYTGRLILTAPGTATFVKAITVSQPVAPQGTLLLDHNSIPLTVNRSFWPSEASRGASATVSVTIREKSGAVPLQGLSVRLEQVASSPESGFDLNNNGAFFVRGKPVALASSSTDALAPERTIEAGKQAEVQIVLRGLRPGDYAAVLRFSAQNSAADDGQKLQLNIHVRDSPVWAVVWIIVALIISFIGTKVLTSQRRRAALLQQVHSLQPPWFAVLPAIAPVTWVRATLYQAEQLSRRFWLTGADQIDASVNSVKSMLTVLDRYRQTRQKLEPGLDWLTFRRAIRSLDDVLSRLTGAALDDAAVQRITGELDAFNDWLRNDTFPGAFWKTVQPGMQALVDEVGDLKQFPSTVTALVTTLKNDIVTALATPPADRTGVQTAYKQYAKLRVLWQHRRKLDDLIDPATKNDLATLFELADKQEWDGLNGNTFTIRWPDSSNPDGFEAYQSLQFSVGFGTDLQRSYLYRHKIVYHWTFELTPKQSLAERLGLRRPPAAMTLTPTSLGPSVVQYFPRQGTTRVSVELEYVGKPIPVPAVDGPRINKSSDYSALGILAGAEVAGWVIASIVAIATGLSTFYFKGTSWGTFQDYLTLLVWGIGVDQGKNFLQALQTFSAAPAANQPKT
jgi:hypothetical protein